MFNFFLVVILSIEIFYPELRDITFGNAGGKINGIDVLLLILFLIIVIHLLIKQINPFKKWSSKQSKFLFVIIIFSLISLSTGLIKYGSPAFGDFRIIFYSLFYFIPLVLIENEEQIKKVIYAVLFGTVILVIQAIIQLLRYTLGITFGEFNYFSHLIRGDAVLLISFLPLYLLSIKSNKHLVKFKKIIKLCSIIWLFVILISQVRSTLVTLSVSFLFYIFFLQNSKNKIKYVVSIFFIVGGIITLYAVITPPEILETNLVRYEGLLHSGNDINTEFRLIGAQAALNQMISNPFFGAPFGKSINFMVGNTPYYRFDPHNSYLYLGSKIGVIGLFFFCLVIIFTIVKGVKNINTLSVQVQTRSLYISLLLFFISTSVFIAFNASLRNDSSGIFFWILLSLLVSMQNIMSKKNRMRNSE